MRRLLLVAIALIATVIFEYWIPALVRHFVGFGVLARLVRPAFCLGLIAWFFANQTHRSRFRISWRWTWVLLIPLVYLAQNLLGVFPHPKLFLTMVVLALVLDGLAIGLIEEFLFRGVAFLGDAEATPKATVFLSALAFSLVHLTALTTGTRSQLVWTIVIHAFPAGIAFGIIRMATGSIAWPAVMHGLIDVCAHFAYPRWTASGRTGPILFDCTLIATGLLFFLHPAMKPKLLTRR